MSPVKRPRLLRGPSLATPVVVESINTERLVLRPHIVEDSERWFEIQSNPQVHAFTSWPERTAEESLQHLKDRTSHVVLKQADDFLALAIEHDGVLVGDISLHLRSVASVTRAAEISWILHPDAQGHGFALEAATAMLDVAFTRLEARFVYALVHPDNVASAVLATKLGFSLLVEAADENVYIATHSPQAQHA